MQKPIVLLPKEAYKRVDGLFGVYVFKQLTWYTCREQFHFLRGWCRQFFYSLPKDQRQKFCEFFDKVEERLKLRRRTKIHQTNVRNVLCLRPARFWRNQMRFSLFTILCRAGIKYNGDVDAAMRDEPYLAKTYRAVQFFFSGRTRYTGIGRGWVDEFSVLEYVRPPKLEVLLVPSWQVFPIYLILRLGKFVGRKIAGLLS